MNKRLQNLIKPGTRLCLLIMAVFAAATFFINDTIAIAEIAVIVLVALYSFIMNRRQRRELVKYIEDVTYNTESAKNNTLMHFPLPIVVFNLDDYRVVWGNQIFFDLFGSHKPSFDVKLTDEVPGFTGKWLKEGKTQYPGLVLVDGRKYQLHGNIIHSKGEGGARSAFMGITYWVDVTEFDNIKMEYEDSRPASMVIAIDNYDEIMKNVPDRTRVELRGQIDEKITQWAEGTNGIVRRFDRDRYMFILECRYLKELMDKKFSILEEIHEIVNPAGIHATLSIGVGRDGNGFEENFSFANLSLEMALSRGGDQAVVKNKYNFEFFGGRGMEVETRTKVKSRVTANALAELMRTSSQIFVMGHKMSDLDCIGAATAVVCIAHKLEKNARIVVDQKNTASKMLIDKLKALPEYEDCFISPDEAVLRADTRSLLVVVDTNRPEQVESRTLLEACNRVVVIDHHRRAASYIQNAALTFHEPFASSVCELMSEIMQELLEQPDISRAEAEAVLSGIMLDTKNFTIRTGERTFEAAAFLRRFGADTSEVKKLLQSDVSSTVAKYQILQSMRVYRGNIGMAVPETPQDRVVAAQAADEMLNISGIEASIVAYPTEDGGVVVSARSIGDINVQLLLENLGGGGNKSAAGAQIANISIRDAVNSICNSIDEYFAQDK